MVSSFSFSYHANHSSFFLSLSLILISLPSWVPLARRLFNGARPSLEWSSHGSRRRILQPPLFLLPPLLLLQVVVWRLRRSWHRFSAWMLVLPLLVMSCVRWPLVSVILHDDRITLVALSLLPLLLQRPLRMRMLMMVLVMTTSQYLTICHSWQKKGIVLG